MTFLTAEIKAVFLLFIAISANFLGNTLNCNLQKELSENPLLRHLFLYIIVYFTIDFTSKSDMSPEEVFYKSIMIYIFYIILTKQTFETFIILFLLLITVYYLYTKINYENSKKIDTKQTEQTMDYIVYIIAIVSLIGFGLYFNKQYTEHYDNFDIIKFIFGTNKCDKL